MFYHKNQGFVCFTIGELRAMLDNLPDNWALSPHMTTEDGFIFSVQSSDADGRWYLGYIDPATGIFTTEDRREYNKRNPSQGAVHSADDDDQSLRNVNGNYPRLAS